MQKVKRGGLYSKGRKLNFQIWIDFGIHTFFGDKLVRCFTRKKLNLKKHKCKYAN